MDNLSMSLQNFQLTSQKAGANSKSLSSMNATFTSLSTHLNEADKNDSFDSCDEEIQDLFSSGYSKFCESSMDSNSMDSISYISANNFSERMYSVYNRNRPNLNFRKMRKDVFGSAESIKRVKPKSQIRSKKSKKLFRLISPLKALKQRQARRSKQRRI